MRARFANCSIDSASHTLTCAGEARLLTPKAFLLLEALVEGAPSAVSKEALYERLWPDVIVEPGNLHNLIAEVREAIGDDEHRIVRTVHRVGYALAAEVIRDGGSPFHLVSGDRDLPLAFGETILGRENAGAPEVSRRHARIVVDDATATIEDLGSKNGTFVRGERIDVSTELHDGDEVILGRARFVFRAGPNENTITA